MNIDFALPVNGSILEGYKQWQRKAATAVMDYSFHMAITGYNAQVPVMSLGATAPSSSLHTIIHLRLQVAF